jgi:hypothetical protein
LVFSDSAVQSLSLLLGWFRRFFPHVPADGAQPGREWTDTLTTTEPGGAATVTRITELRARAGAAWELRPEGEALRLDAEETYQVTGSGDGGGQPLELRGTGVRSGTDYIAVDGRYLGGTSRDSVALTITLQQGITIPSGSSQPCRSGSCLDEARRHCPPVARRRREHGACTGRRESRHPVPLPDGRARRPCRLGEPGGHGRDARRVGVR